MNNTKRLERKNISAIFCNTYLYNNFMVFNCNMTCKNFFDIYIQNTDSHNKMMQRSKKECINQIKVKEIYGQILKGKIFIPTIYVALEGPLSYFDLEDKQIEINHLKHILNSKTNLLGKIEITSRNVMETLTNFDLIEAFKQVWEFNSETLKDYSLNINFIYSVIDDRKKFETLFVEINKYNSILPNHIKSYFNNNDVYGNIARELINIVPSLEVIVESNKINISKYQNKIYTFNNILSSIELFGSALSKSGIEGDVMYKKLQERTTVLFKELLSNNYIAECIVEPKKIPYIKEQNVLTSAVGLSLVTKILYKYVHDDEMWLKCLNKCVSYNWSRDNDIFLGNIIKKLDNRLKIVNTKQAVSNASLFIDNSIFHRK